MGAPWFKIKHLAQSDDLMALSANFSLYGDLSQRMMNVIGQFSPLQEIYSIDEFFLDLTGIPGTGREIGSSIRQRVRQWVGIPTCVGIGPTKTFAKLANHLAKKVARLEGVSDLSSIDNARRLRVLSGVDVGDVWGVGRRLGPKLRALGIHSAADLASADFRVIRDTFSIVLAKTARELAGESCLDWEDSPTPKKEIMCSCSFGSPVLSMDDLAQALSVFVSRAAEKLRREDSYTPAILVFIQTSHFRPDPQYSGATVVQLHRATDSTAELLAAVGRGLRKIYRPGFKYSKAGVCLMNLTSAESAHAQGELFAAPPPANKLMDVVDALNERYGKATVAAASTLSKPDAPWQMRQERMTPAYTTDWDQVIDVWR